MIYSSKRLYVRLGVLLLAIVWLGVTIGGLVALWAYETSPGSQGAAPANWPAMSTLVRASDKPTLLLFAHPKCPCTRATLTEFARLLSAADVNCSAQIVYFIPATHPEWASSELCQAAQQIEKAHVVMDIDGAQSRLFGTETSGHVLLYDREGHLRFTGGITPARGQTGANRGAQAVLAQLRSETLAWSETSVLGCSLLGSRNCAAGGDACRTP